MNTRYRHIAAALLITIGVSAHARDVNIGVSIAGEFQPGVYGQVNVNTMPSYSTMYAQPTVVVQQPIYAVPVAPVYMHVPVVQAQNWSNYCGYYGACSRPVYFVQPRYPQGHYYEHGRSHHHGHHRH